MQVPRFIRSLFLLSLGAAFLTPLHALQEEEIWTTFNLTEFKSDHFETRSHLELRFPELEYLSYYRLSQKFYIPTNTPFTFGIHPVIERGRKSANGEWSDTYRLDLEANFGFKLGEVSVKTRNRYEIRRKEGRGSEAFDRVRQYTTLSYPADWLPGMSSIAIGNEIFVEFDDTRITINRFYPLRVTFKAAGGKITPYLLYQTKRSGNSDNWSAGWILGTSASYSF